MTYPHGWKSTPTNDAPCIRCANYHQMLGGHLIGYEADGRPRFSKPDRCYAVEGLVVPKLRADLQAAWDGATTCPCFEERRDF